MRTNVFVKKILCISAALALMLTMSIGFFKQTYAADKASENVVNASASDLLDRIDYEIKNIRIVKNTDKGKAYYQKIFSGNVIIGDSLTEGLKLYKYLDENEAYSKVSASILYSDDLFAPAAASKPERAFFAFGMNDMGNFDGNYESFIAKYSEILKSFHDSTPDTKIYVCGITPPTDKAISVQPILGTWEEFNDAIKDMCDDSDYLTYMDTTGIFKDHPEMYAGDGIHAGDVTYYSYYMDLIISETDMHVEDDEAN